jgi:1-acyl-sn-glycerol-3-phosphate acyltransferase
MLWHAAVAALLLRVVYPRISFERRRAVIRWWSRKLLRILNVRTRVEGEAPAATERGAMIAANHVSWLDIFLVSSVRPTRFIAKSEIRDWPIAGWIADKAGTLFIRRDQWRDTARINAKVRAALAEGDCVGLFPEGITTEGDRLLKFHSSLFEPAVANHAHVHPAAIRYESADGTLCREMSFFGERSFMESLALIIGQRSVTACVSFAAPVETEGATRREVTKAAEARVATLLNLPIAGTEPGRAAGLPGAPR